MRIAVLVNDSTELTARQSTSMLAHAAVARGHEVWIVGVTDIEMTPEARIYALARSAAGTDSLARLVDCLPTRKPRRIDLESCDVLLMRTNPGRDERQLPAHECVLGVARILVERGVLVLNEPRGLTRAASKLALFELPAAVRPKTFIGRTAGAITDFIHSLDGPAVIKPLSGTRGQDVFRISEHDRANQNQIIEVILRGGGYLMAQEYVPGADAGDTRVLVLDGDILEVDGRIAAVTRVPKQGDFRSNIHAGGQPTPGIITDDIRAAVDAISGWLRDHGLFLVGLDFIGGRIIEMNIFSPGGLFDSSADQERDFPGAIVQAIEARHAR
jgi:glutathione synthase